MNLLANLLYLKCLVHPNNHLSHFCLAQGCKNRLVCLNCKKDHTSSHHVKFIPIRSFVLKDIASDLDKARNFLVDTQNKAQKIISVTDIITQKLKRDFEDTLSIIRADIFVEVNKLQNEIENAKKVSDQAEKSLSRFFTSPEKEFHNSAQALLSFYSTYVKELEALKENSHILMNKKIWLDDKVDELSLSLQTSYKELENFFMDELDVKDLKPEREISSESFWGANCIEVLDKRDLVITSNSSSSLLESINVLSIKEAGFEKVSSIKGFKQISQIEFSEKNSYIFANSDSGVINVIKLEPNCQCRLIKRIKADPQKIYDFLVLDDLGKLITAGFYGITVWNLPKLTYESRIPKAYSKPVTSLVFISKRNLIGCFYAHLREILLIDIKTNNQVAMLRTESTQNLSPNDLNNIQDYSISMLYLEKKDMLVAGKVAGKIKCWSLEDISQPRLVHEKKIEGSSSGKIKIMALKGEEKLMFTCSTRKIYQLDLASGFMKESEDLTISKYDNFAFIPKKKLFVLLLDMGLSRPIMKV